MLTYQEAVEAGARVLYAHDLIPAEHALDPEWDALVVGSTGQQWRAIGYRDTIRAVLKAVGYADLLAEVENLRITVREDLRVMDRDAIAIKRLRLLASRWQEIVSAPSFDAAVNAAAQSYHETECIYGAEVTRLRAGIEALDLDFLENVAYEIGHTIYEATELEPAECTDECNACFIEDTVARLRALLAGRAVGS